MHTLSDGDALAHDFAQAAAFAQRYAQGEVARLLRVAGQHQIAQARQAHQGLRLGAQGHGEAGHLGQAAGDQSGARVVAQPLAADDAAGDGQHVLDGAAKLGADDVVRRVHPEGAGTERHRQGPAQPSSPQASVTAVGSSRATSAAKLGPVSTATGTPGRVCSTTSLIRAQVPLFDPLGADHRRYPPPVRAGAPQGGAQMLGRHRQQDDVGRRHRLRGLGYGAQVRIESDARQIALVAPGARDGLRDRRVVCLHDDSSAGAPRHCSQRRAPCARTEDPDPVHDPVMVVRRPVRKAKSSGIAADARRRRLR